MHLRGIVIAGALAALALALGLVTLAMNQSAAPAASVKTIVPLKDRPGAASSAKKKAAAAHRTPVHKPNPHLVAALKAGLPRSVARALAARPVAVVEFTSSSDTVAQVAAAEAKVAAGIAGVSFVPISVDKNGGDVAVMTQLLGSLPSAPATLVYTRPATLVSTLPGFNDRTVVEQAAESAASAATAAPAPAAGAK